MAKFRISKAYAIFRYIADFNRKPEYLPPRTLYSFRHTFAVNYLRRGGSVFHWQKLLGHSTLEMTRGYANLTTEDLQSVHQSISLFSS